MLLLYLLLPISLLLLSFPIFLSLFPISLFLWLSSSDVFSFFLSFLLSFNFSHSLFISSFCPTFFVSYFLLSLNFIVFPLTSLTDWLPLCLFVSLSLSSSFWRFYVSSVSFSVRFNFCFESTTYLSLFYFSFFSLVYDHPLDFARLFLSVFIPFWSILPLCAFYLCNVLWSAKCCTANLLSPKKSKILATVKNWNLNFKRVIKLWLRGYDLQIKLTI